MTISRDRPYHSSASEPAVNRNPLSPCTQYNNRIGRSDCLRATLNKTHNAGLTSPKGLCYPYRFRNSSPKCWMPLKPQRIEVVLETVLESIALAEEVGLSVAAAAGFDEDDQYKIGLAV